MPDFDPSQPDPGASSDPSFDPSMMASMTSPMPSFQQPQTPPVYQAPQQQVDPELHAAAVHHGRIASALNSVADILGGNKTLKLMKNSDGSVSITQQDATTGEKWGRVAQAALSGAAKGFIAGQGPGGPGKAAAAGIETGLAMPKQQQDQTLATAEQWNDQDRKKKLFDANMAHMTQTLAQQAWQMQNQQTLASEHEEDRLKDFNTYKDNAHLKFIGKAKTLEDGANLFNGNPDVQQAITDGRLVFHQTFDPKTRQSTGGEIYVAPVDKANSLHMKPETYHLYSSDENGKIKDEPYTIDGGTNTESQHLAALNSQNLGYQKAITTSGTIKDQQQQALLRGAQIKTQGAEAYKDYQQAALAKAQIPVDPFSLPGGGGGGAGAPGGAPGGTPGAPPASLGSNAPRTADDGTPMPSEAGDKILAALDPGTAALVKQFGEYRGQIADLGRSKNREQYSKLIAAIYPQWDKKNYAERQKALNSIAPGGNLANTKSAINLAIQHLDQMYTAMSTVSPARFTAVNDAENWLRNQGFAPNKTTKAAGDYETAKTGASEELAKAFAGTGSASVTEVNDWRNAGDINKPRPTQEGHFKTATKMLASRLEIADQLYRDGMGTTNHYNVLTPQSVEALQRLPGGKDLLKQFNVPASQPGTVPPIPSGHTQAVNYVHGSDGKFYWIEPENMAAAKKTDPNLQVVPR